MQAELTLFLSTFTTLLAIINPLEALPVFLRLLDGKSEEAHQSTARLSVPKTHRTPALTPPAVRSGDATHLLPGLRRSGLKRVAAPGAH